MRLETPCVCVRVCVVSLWSVCGHSVRSHSLPHTDHSLTRVWSVNGQ